MRPFYAKTVEELKMAEQSRPAIAQAWKVIKSLSGDKKDQRLTEYEERIRREEINTLDYILEKGRKEGLEKGREKGLEIGREEGREEATAIFVRNALLKKMSHADIVALTGLPLEKVKKLESKLPKQ
jgi:predicted transposase/invertase (TIGR01784 family)